MIPEIAITEINHRAETYDKYLIYQDFDGSRQTKRAIRSMLK